MVPWRRPWILPAGGSFQNDFVANGRVVIMPLFSVLFTTERIRMQSQLTSTHVRIILTNCKWPLTRRSIFTLMESLVFSPCKRYFDEYIEQPQQWQTTWNQAALCKYIYSMLIGSIYMIFVGINLDLDCT